MYVPFYDIQTEAKCLLTNIKDEIDKESYEVRKEDDEVYDNIEDLIEELPDNSARFVVLSYPFKLPDGRLKSPLVLVYWRPPTSGQASKMLYAGAVELIRDKAGVSKYVLIRKETVIETILTIQINRGN